MAVTLYNTFTKTKEVFTPLMSGKVGMYHCGPTVYYFAHIGNLRSYVFADILRRTCEYNGLQTAQVINITDVGHLTSDADSGDDKMTKALLREGKPLTMEAMKEIADVYTTAFKEDLRKLNIETTGTHFPRASEFIDEQIGIIKKINAKGITYSTSDGVYFDTSKIEHYGKLGGISEEAQESRIGINSQKKNQRDFALWKFNKDLGWESPWGKGFPGWHIECSAMSTKLLGETFDIHTGGVDHIPVHHNNEIAQSETATGKVYAHFWLHNAFVIIDGGKMAKSTGNFLTLGSLIEKVIAPLAYRYWLLTAHYRTQVNFTWEAIGAAQTALIKLYTHFAILPHLNGDTTKLDAAYQAQFLAYVNDDLDTPQAIALVWKLLKDKKITDEVKRATLVDFDRVLGLGLASFTPETTPTEIPPEVEALAEARELARKEKDFTQADALRKEIEARGFEVKDTEGGFKIIAH